jgi:type II secretory pathway component PulF
MRDGFCPRVPDQNLPTANAADAPREVWRRALSNWRMKYDEFAFLNQQLAGMLKSGIPLEPALRQMCATMRRGHFRAEFEALDADLRQGIALNEALASRRLPDFYKQMVRVGIKSNNLPAILTLLADYYQKTHVLWTRLKTLLIYPLIVLVFCFGLSFLLVAIAGPLSANLGTALGYTPFMGEQANPMAFAAGMLMPLFVLGLVLAIVLAVLAVPRWRRNARWVLPGFKEAHLSRFASALALMLKTGCDLKSALAVLRQMEAGQKWGRNWGVGRAGWPKARRNSPTWARIPKWSHHFFSGWWRDRAKTLRWV